MVIDDFKQKSNWVVIFVGIVTVKNIREEKGLIQKTKRNLLRYVACAMKNILREESFRNLKLNWMKGKGFWIFGKMRWGYSKKILPFIKWKSINCYWRYGYTFRSYLKWIERTKWEEFLWEADFFNKRNCSYKRRDKEIR